MKIKFYDTNMQSATIIIPKKLTNIIGSGYKLIQTSTSFQIKSAKTFEGKHQPKDITWVRNYWCHSRREKRKRKK